MKMRAHVGRATKRFLAATMSPLQGYGARRSPTQGFALGYRIRALRAQELRAPTLTPDP